MSVTLLRTLIAVADTGSFVAASDRVHVSQAAVGQQMRKLEELLGVALFDRKAKPPTLTELAQSLLPQARDVVDSYDRLISGAGGAGALTGSITLGAVPSSLQGLVPTTLKRLTQSTPQVQVQVIPALSSDLLEMVDSGAVDAAITSALFKASLRFRTYHIAQEPLVLIAAQGTPQASAKELLRTQPYIRHTQRAAAGQIADEWLSRNQIDVTTTMELESLETVANVVAHGLGVSVVPNICMPDAIFASLRRLPLEETGRSLSLLTRADCSKALLIERLMEEILESIRLYKEKL